MKSFKQFITENTTPVTGIHYSNVSGLSYLSGDKSGTGIKGAEQDRLSTTKDDRIKKRVYFYPKPAEGLPRPESGLGVHFYEAKLHNMYDTTKESDKSVVVTEHAKKRVNAGEHPSNAFESAVLDSGFHGYHAHNMSVVLGRSVPVTYKGTSVGHKFTEPSKPADKKYSVFNSDADKEGYHQSSLLSGEQSMYFQKNKDKFKSVAPSVGMQYGRLRVHKDDLDKLRGELKNHSQSF